MPLYLRGSALTLAASMVLCSGAGASADSRAQGTKTEFCLGVQRVVEMRTAGFSPVRGAVDGPASDDGFQFYDAQFNPQIEIRFRNVGRLSGLVLTIEE